LSDREKNGNFASYFDFCKRMYDGLNRRALESLVKCGALDSLGLNRRQMLNGAESVLDYLTEDKKQNVEGQIGFFDAAEKAGREEFRIGPMPDLSAADKLDMEKEVTGMYLSGHPMAAYVDLYDTLKAVRIGNILEEAKEGTGDLRDGAAVTVLGIITKVRLKVTKSNSTMAFVTLEDLFGSIRMLVFPKTLTDYAELIAEGRIVKVFARISLRDENDAELICQTIEDAPQPGKNHTTANRHTHSRPGLYLKVGGRDDPLYRKAMKYIAVFDGPTPLYIYFCDSKKLMAAPISMRVSVNDVLLRELKKLLGGKNVALVDNLQQ
jgi:DNA polymerase-3 subunit alpha